MKNYRRYAVTYAEASALSWAATITGLTGTLRDHENELNEIQMALVAFAARKIPVGGIVARPYLELSEQALDATFSMIAVAAREPVDTDVNIARRACAAVILMELQAQEQAQGIIADDDSSAVDVLVNLSAQWCAAVSILPVVSITTLN